MAGRAGAADHGAPTKTRPRSSKILLSLNSGFISVVQFLLSLFLQFLNSPHSQCLRKLLSLLVSHPLSHSLSRALGVARGEKKTWGECATTGKVKGRSTQGGDCHLYAHCAFCQSVPMWAPLIAMLLSPHLRHCRASAFPSFAPQQHYKPFTLLL